MSDGITGKIVLTAGNFLSLSLSPCPSKSGRIDVCFSGVEETSKI
jgi:hypothetical protein